MQGFAQWSTTSGLSGRFQVYKTLGRDPEGGINGGPSDQIADAQLRTSAWGGGMPQKSHQLQHLCSLFAGESSAVASRSSRAA